MQLHEPCLGNRITFREMLSPDRQAAAAFFRSRGRWRSRREHRYGRVRPGLPTLTPGRIELRIRLGHADLAGADMDAHFEERRAESEEELLVDPVDSDRFLPALTNVRGLWSWALEIESLEKATGCRIEVGAWRE